MWGLQVFVLAIVAAAAAQAAVDWRQVKAPKQFFPDKFTPIKTSKHGGRITNGEEATLGQFPYQVGLVITVSDGQAFCGGSLLSDSWVLTAGHCGDPGTLFEVHLGALYVRQDEEQQVVLTTTDKIVHPDYTAVPPSNDVALLRLPSAVALNEYIQPINLPARSELNNKFVDVNTVVSGWGLDSDSSEDISEVLRYVESPVISHLTCNLRYFLLINDDIHICTSGDDGKSTCQGDSGGPLVITEADGSKTQIGVVSFGIRFGCEIGWPPVFARLTAFTEWISEQTGIALRD